MNHDQPSSAPTGLPLEGVRVIEFTHMVMGPTCGMILGDLGAEVIKVEPPGGDKTRRLIGSGAGFFSLFNRNKKSVTADLSNAKDRARIEKLIAAREPLMAGLPGEPVYGMTPEAGLPKGFIQFSLIAPKKAAHV